MVIPFRIISGLQSLDLKLYPDQMASQSGPNPHRQLAALQPASDASLGLNPLFCWLDHCRVKQLLFANLANSFIFVGNLAICDVEPKILPHTASQIVGCRDKKRALVQCMLI